MKSLIGTYIHATMDSLLDEVSAEIAFFHNFQQLPYPQICDKQYTCLKTIVRECVGGCKASSRKSSFRNHSDLRLNWSDHTFKENISRSPACMLHSSRIESQSLPRKTVTMEQSHATSNFNLPSINGVASRWAPSRISAADIECPAVLQIPPQREKVQGLIVAGCSRSLIEYRMPLNKRQVCVQIRYYLASNSWWARPLMVSRGAREA